MARPTNNSVHVKSLLLGGWMVLSVSCDAVEKQTSHLPYSFDERRMASMRDIVGVRRETVSNTNVLRRDVLEALRGLKEADIRHPKLVSSHYYPQSVNDEGQIAINIRWIEDVPSLRKVIVRNPETEAECEVEISEGHLELRRQDDAMMGLLYIYSARFLADVYGNNPSQVMELMTVDRKQLVNCYPWTIVDPE